MPPRPVTFRRSEAAIAPLHNLGPMTQDSQAAILRGFIPKATTEVLEPAMRDTPRRDYAA